MNDFNENANLNENNVDDEGDGHSVASGSSESGSESEDRGSETSESQGKPIRLAVVPPNFPVDKLLPDQGEMIQKFLVDMIENSNIVGPQFQRSYFFQGALIFHCMNERTCEWLESCIDDICESVGANVEVRDVNDIFKSCKVLVHAPKLLKKVHPVAILQRLEIQNPGVHTQGWVIMDRKIRKDGQTLVLKIDEESLKMLEEREFKLFLGMGKVMFKVLRRFLPMEPDEGPDSPDDPDDGDPSGGMASPGSPGIRPSSDSSGNGPPLDSSSSGQPPDGNGDQPHSSSSQVNREQPGPSRGKQTCTRSPGNRQHRPRSPGNRHRP